MISMLFCRGVVLDKSLGIRLGLIPCWLLCLPASKFSVWWEWLVRDTAACVCWVFVYLHPSTVSTNFYST